VHDRGEAEGKLWISMDYVDGLDASKVQRRCGLQQRCDDGHAGKRPPSLRAKAVRSTIRVEIPLLFTPFRA
jgi:hypothetical protein